MTTPMETRRAALLAALQDPEEEVRRTAAEALDRLPLLEGLAEDQGPSRTWDKVEWLRRLRPLREVRDDAALRLALRGLRHPEEDVRLASLDLIASFRDWRTTRHVSGALADESPVVRARAAEVLGSLGDRRGAPDLVPLLEDGDPRVVTHACVSLGLLGHAGAEEQLIGLLKHRDPDARAGAASALGRLPLTVRS